MKVILFLFFSTFNIITFAQTNILDKILTQEGNKPKTVSRAVFSLKALKSYTTKLSNGTALSKDQFYASTSRVGLSVNPFLL